MDVATFLISLAVVVGACVLYIGWLVWKFSRWDPDK